VIYTGLTEAFFTYIQIAAFAALSLTMPVISFQIYKFIAPGLYPKERHIASAILCLAPILFWSGGLFVFYCVVPKAWQFFLSFEIKDATMPLILEARISEYLHLIIQLILAFGLAFQLPVIFLILTLLGIVSSAFLINKRRIAIVINFVIAGIITPPDILSQIALALPMLLLYELSILACKFLENRSH
jgi:sec-independent protein translocase protein TatC